MRCLIPRHRRVNGTYAHPDDAARTCNAHRQPIGNHENDDADPEDADPPLPPQPTMADLGPKPEPKLLSGSARWILVILVTGMLTLFYYVSSGDGYAAVESTSGLSVTRVLGKAARKALNGGVAGFTAGVAQVLLFMWMRTMMNYQYAHGGTAMNAFHQLYADGGLPRFYQGLTFAIIQAPLARFGDVAFNTAVLALFDEWAPGTPAFLATAVASAFGAGWRIFISPVDTLKTALQVNGREAVMLLTARIRDGGLMELYAGAVANFGANWLGNYPWFATYNTLQSSVPRMDGAWKYARNGIIGIIASCVSDVTSNSLRVIKTVKQVSGNAGVRREDVLRFIFIPFFFTFIHDDVLPRCIKYRRQTVYIYFVVDSLSPTLTLHFFSPAVVMITIPRGINLTLSPRQDTTRRKATARWHGRSSPRMV